MRVQTSSAASLTGMVPSSTLHGSGNPMVYPIFRRISWLSDPTSWFARRVESQIQTQRRSVDRQSTMMWEDFGVTISFADGRLLLSLYRHSSVGSVASYFVEETLGDETEDLRFAGRGWRVQN